MSNTLNSFKIVCENGDHWSTSFNGSLEEAKKYFLNTQKVYENFETGKATKTEIIGVIDLKLRKDLYYCLNCGGVFPACYDELDLFILLEDIKREDLNNWSTKGSDICKAYMLDRSSIN